MMWEAMKLSFNALPRGLQRCVNDESLEASVDIIVLTSNPAGRY